MAVTTARLRQALAMRGFQAGELADDRQGNKTSAPNECPQLLIRQEPQSHWGGPYLDAFAPPPR